MAEVRKCPVCCGTGSVDRSRATDTAVRIETCNGCSGKGWIVISDPPIIMDTMFGAVWITPNYTQWRST